MTEQWVQEVISELEKIKPRTKAIKNAIRVFTEGLGWYTGDKPSKIFWWSDLNDDNASK